MHAASPANLAPQKTLRPQFEERLPPTQMLQSTAPAVEASQLSVLRKFEDENFRITGYVASRNGQAAPDYRVYVGLGYRSELGSLAKVTSHAFYGTGTYDGLDANAGALPADVRANGALLGNWLGADWKVESQLWAGHTFSAGFEYREQLPIDVLDLNTLTQHPASLDDTQPERRVGMVTQNSVTLSSELALKVRMRYDEHDGAFDAIAPRVELVYKPEQSSKVSAVFDQSTGSPLAQQRAVTPWTSAATDSDRIRNYELAYAKSLWQSSSLRVSAYRYDVERLFAALPDASDSSGTSGAPVDTRGLEVGMERNVIGGTRGRLGYALQETRTGLPGFSTENLAQHVGKLSLAVPLLPNRLSTSFELQYIDLIGSPAGDPHNDFIIGNLTLASASLADGTHVTFGMRNVFDTQLTGGSLQLLSAIPTDGRSVRVDFTRKL